MAKITCPNCGGPSDLYDGTDWCTPCVELELELGSEDRVEKQVFEL